MVQEAQGLVRTIFGRSLTEPAANKWTKIDPVIRRVLLKAWFGIWFRRAVGMKLGKRDEAGSADGTFGLNPDGAIGVPMDM